MWPGILRDAQSSDKKQIINISVISYVIVFIFYIQMSIHENFIWIMSFKAGLFRHARPWSKCSKITNNQYLKKELSYCLDILYTVRDSRKLQINLVMLVDCSQACFGIPKVRRNNGSAISGKSDCLAFFCQQFDIHGNCKLCHVKWGL